MCPWTLKWTHTHSDVPRLNHWEPQLCLMASDYKKIGCTMAYSPKFNLCISEVTATYIMYILRRKHKTLQNVKIFCGPTNLSRVSTW